MLKQIMEKIKQFYETRYKFLLIGTFLLLFLALTQIGWQWYSTGDFLHKGVSLKGGMTITVPTKTVVAPEQIQKILAQQYPENDITVRELRSSVGEQSGIVIDADIREEQTMQNFLATIAEQTGVSKELMSIETFGSRLSQSFFKELFIGLLIAFLFMGCVVFFYFKDFIPSVAVMLAASCDIVITLAVVNILGIKISTAGIAAFLMLIGYSVDTDILLTIRVLKHKDDGTLNERIYGAMKTGGLMTITAIAAVSVVLLFTNSDVLFQIMLILFIGLCADLMTTWIQNVGILRWYLESKKGAEE